MIVSPRFVLAGILALASSAWGAEITATDDRGRTVTLPAPAQRIVAMAPSITELAYAAGAGARLVGVARYSDYPAAAQGVPQVGDASRIDLERVLSLQPDLVIGWKSGNQVADVERLETLGFKVYIVEPATLAAIPPLLRAVGSLAGTGVVARIAADEFERSIAALRERYGARRTVRVFYEIWHTPLMTVNGRHMINDVIRLCGGSNVFAGLPTLTPVVSLEGVIAAQPEVVLGGSSATAPDEFAAQWRSYEGFVKLRNV
ncbi:MAG: cobalamin-binding protein, partial [Pseudomonadota bacterium]